MQRFLLLCVLGMAALCNHAEASSPPKPIQAFSAVQWTTTTLHSPGGKTSVFVRRTVVTRDASGNMLREVYRPTKGLLRDTTAPLERSLPASTSTQTRLPHLQSSKGTMAPEAELGVLKFSGLPATGRRQVFLSADGQPEHTLETWFCETLGLTVHMESRNARGDTVISDVSELHLDNAISLPVAAAPAVGPPIPLSMLYRVLFTQVAHIERDRLANDPNLHVNMNDIEDHLRSKMSLSDSQWHVLLDKSVKVEDYTREKSKLAHDFAEQDRASRRQNPLSANTLPAGRETLHQMQLDLNTHIQGEIEGLKAAVGPDATGRIQTYLLGSLAASTSVVPSRQTRTQAQKGQPR